MTTIPYQYHRHDSGVLVVSFPHSELFPFDTLPCPGGGAAVGYLKKQFSYHHEQWICWPHIPFHLHRTAHQPNFSYPNRDIIGVDRRHFNRLNWVKGPLSTRNPEKRIFKLNNSVAAWWSQCCEFKKNNVRFIAVATDQMGIFIIQSVSRLMSLIYQALAVK